MTPFKQAIEAAAQVAEKFDCFTVDQIGCEALTQIAAAIRAIPIPEPAEDDRPTERVTTEQSDQLHQALKASAPDVVDARLFHPLVHDRTDPARQRGARGMSIDRVLQ